MTSLVENTSQKMSFESFTSMFMLKMKQLADKHAANPVKYFVVINPEDEYDTVFKNQLFKTTNKYDLWLRVNKLTKGHLYHYNEKYLDDILYEQLEDECEEEFDYSLVTPEKKIEVLIKYVIEVMEERNEDYYWVELSLD